MTTSGELYEWDRKSTLDLIEMYKTYDMLWDPKHKNYKNKPVRQNALREISNHLNIDKSEIERKFKNISSHYLRELKKERESDISGGAAYKSKWFAFKALEFLSNRPTHFRSKTIDQSTSESMLIEGEEASENSEQSSTEYTPTLDFESKSQTIKIEDPSEYTSALEYEPKCKSIKIEDPLIEFESRPLEIARDDSSTFGEYVATKIRPMDKRTKAIVEYEINSIIFKAEMGYYSDKKFEEPNENSVT